MNIYNNGIVFFDFYYDDSFYFLFICLYLLAAFTVSEDMFLTNATFSDFLKCSFLKYYIT